MTCQHTSRKVLALLALTLAAAGAQAESITYSFTTGASVSGNAEVRSLLGTSEVSGQFTFRNDTARTGNTSALGLGGNAELFIGAASGLSGSVGGHSFADPTLSMTLVNDAAPSNAYRDLLQVFADAMPAEGANTVPTAFPRSLSGFDLGAYRLHNVRLFWFTPQGSASELLADKNLPASLPTTLSGRLALDFVLISDPNNTANTPYFSRTVFFDGLTLQQASTVPEASAATMTLAGLGGLLALGLRARRRG